METRWLMQRQKVLSLDFPGKVLQGECMAIEVSEFGALRHTSAAMRMRYLFRARGGKFGIDQFGLDPKALNLLRELLPDFVKLTGALIDDVAKVELVSDMPLSFVELAYSLDLLV